MILFSLLNIIMITYYINLDSATVRKNKFENTDYIRFRATPRDEVPELVDKKMHSMYNFPRQGHLGRCGWFFITYKIIRKNS